MVLRRTICPLRAPSCRYVIRSTEKANFLGLQGECVTIGRHPQSDLFLDDVTVSRRHARIHIAPGDYTIEDEGSLNGTYVNRRRIEIHQLFDGDEVQIGKFRLAFLEQKAEG